MNDPTERAVARALDSYAQDLRALAPSTALNARMETAISAWAEQSAAHRVWRRPLPWMAAAASVAVTGGGIALLMSRDGQRDSDAVEPRVVSAPAPTPRRSELAYARLSPLAAGQVSLYPAESAIFRVKASFASAVSLPQAGEPHQGERQYWVDVRIANDGTMRIVQVIPAERGRVVPRD